MLLKESTGNTFLLLKEFVISNKKSTIHTVYWRALISLKMMMINKGKVLLQIMTTANKKEYSLKDRREDN